MKKGHELGHYTAAIRKLESAARVKVSCVWRTNQVTVCLSSFPFFYHCFAMRKLEAASRVKVSCVWRTNQVMAALRRRRAERG